LAAKQSRWELGLLALVMLLATGLRLWQIDTIPPGLDYDEAANGVDALYVLAGDRPIFFTGNNGREPLFIYIIAGAFGLFGPSTLAMRMISVLGGIATVLGIYLVGRRMFNPPVGLIAAFLMASSFWHISLSRVGLRASLLPLLEIAVLYCLWRGLQQRSLRWFGLSGAMIGLVGYSYLAGRLAPVWLGAFLLAAMLFRPWRLAMPIRRYLTGVGVLAFCAFLVFAPIGWYYIHNQEQFFYRSTSVVSTGAPNPEPLQDVVNTLLMFTITGDPNQRRDLPGRPVFDWIQGIAFYAGAILALARWRRPEGILCVLVTGVMLMPGMLSTDSPHFLRTVGVLPAIMPLAAISIWEIAVRARDMSGRYQQRWSCPAVVCLVGAAILWGSVTSFYDYFWRWAPSRQTYDAFQSNALDAARLAGELSARGQVALGVMAFYRQAPIPLAIAGVDPRVTSVFDANSCLLGPVRTSDDFYYVTFSEDAYFRPGASEQLVSGVEPAVILLGPGGDPAVSAYRAAPGGLGLRQPQYPTKIRLGDAIEVYGYDLPRRAAPGTQVTLRVYWQLLQPVVETGDRMFFAHLVGSRDERWASAHREGCPPPTLSAGDRAITWFPLNLSPGTPEGTLQLVFGRFDTLSGENLLVYDGAGREIGKSALLGRTRVFDTASRIHTPTYPKETRLAGGIDFIGYDLPAGDTVRPGRSLPVTLYWRANSAPDRDYTVFAQLLSQDGKVIAQQDSQPQAQGYPTSLWGEGEIVPDQRALLVPANLPPQSFQLIVGMYDLSTGKRLATMAGSPGGPGDYIELSPIRLE
jgi:4-amino-4-deoxy-L-arabinose transferase-like glycosyltransferase